MKENELKFIELVDNSSSNFTVKLERVLKSQVLSQLSRPMLNELFTYWKDYIDNSFNPKAVCMQCAASLFNVTKRIAHKYFELREIQKNELIAQEENLNLLDYSNSDLTNTQEVNIDLIEEKTEIVNQEIEEKIIKRGRPKSK